ncbi:MAG: helicase [Tenericutes bacterium HGW-Tenericutes-1]|jgi:superfamily II DNA or RNA helicase|nr:MAG: helicase [Tenericutes bacterium HGW-Tenericutes-1]PKM95824.1 MAG: helicase [Firmicutes bacterium HGW-Firmicutes-1]
MSTFQTVVPNIEGNRKLRTPQIEAYLNIKEYFINNPQGEALVVLPTGTGKSGLISIAPYGIAKKRVLIITPGLVTKKSVVKSLHPLEENFWIKYDVIFDPEDQPVVEEYQPDMLESSLKKCDFIITNVQKLQSKSKKSLINRVDPDFFDMVIIDEAHHSVANTWVKALKYFKKAKKLHVTGTPYRGDQQELPGKEIHNTALSEVMALKYVKWLRNQPVNNHELYFTIPGNDQRLSKDEVLEFKDKEWIEKSVAMSKECSMDVIKESIRLLKDYKASSPKVQHKILATACSIAHAEDIKKWYELAGMRVEIVHSDINSDELEKRFLRIEDHECDVVVSVNMLMEGYDHKYLTVLALFRPYRSLNAFAQVVGRVLRAIPDDEITAFEIDNNAVIVYHEETGLTDMWNFFSEEVEKSKKYKIREYSGYESDYKHREIIFAEVDIDGHYSLDQGSYLKELDFSRLFEEARERVKEKSNARYEELKKSNLSKDELEALRNFNERKVFDEEKDEIDAIMLDKRPEAARKRYRDMHVKSAQEGVDQLLEKKGIDPKASTLYNKFKGVLYGLSKVTPNDGILVRYVNARVSKRYGKMDKRELGKMGLSLKYMHTILVELEEMI